MKRTFAHIVVSMLISISLLGPSLATYFHWDFLTEEIVMNDHTDEESKELKTEKEKQEKELFAQEDQNHALYDANELLNWSDRMDGRYSAFLDRIFPPPEHTA